MKLFFRNIGALIIGIVIGSIINIGFIILGGNIFPLPESFDSMNALNWDIKYFLFPFSAHAIGTFSGSFMGSKICKNYSKLIAGTVGIYFLSGGIYMTIILPAPIWFVSIDLIFSYIPMAFLGWYFAMKNTKEQVI